jgi:hypothetical protein
MPNVSTSFLEIFWGTSHLQPKRTSDMQGMITTSPKGGSTAGGAIGMPVISGGLVGIIVATLAFLGGMVTVLA